MFAEMQIGYAPPMNHQLIHLVRNPPELRDLLEKWLGSVENRSNRMVSVDSLLSQVDEDRAQLWVMVEEEEGQARDIIGAVVTEIGEYPSGKRVLQILAAGGEKGRMKDGFANARDRCEAFAKENLCDAVIFMGRAGWARWYPDYTETARVFEKEIEYGRS